MCKKMKITKGDENTIIYKILQTREMFYWRDDDEHRDEITLQELNSILPHNTVKSAPKASIKPKKKPKEKNNIAYNIAPFILVINIAPFILVIGMPLGVISIVNNYRIGQIIALVLLIIGLVTFEINLSRDTNEKDRTVARKRHKSELDPDINALLNNDKGVVNIVTGDGLGTTTELMQWFKFLEITGQLATSNQIILNNKQLMTDLKLIDKAAGEFDKFNFNYSVDIKNLPNYDQLAKRIRQNLKQTKREIRQELITPDVREIVQNIIKSDNKHLLELLPQHIHKEYSSQLIQNALN